jgi:hypothetical protein
MRAIASLLGLAVVAAILIASNVYLLAFPAQTTLILPESAPNNNALPNEEVSLRSQDKELLLIHTQTRPLFSPTRRPWVAPVSEPVPAPVVAPEPIVIEPVVAVEVQPPQISLLGIDITPAGAKALALKTGEADAVWVRVGELLDGWTVRVIKSTSIELDNGTKTVMLDLYPALPPPVALPQGSQP